MRRRDARPSCSTLQRRRRARRCRPRSATRWPLDDQVVHARQRRRAGGRRGELGRDRRAGEVPQLGERARSRRVRPARMMLTRSQSRSTSARMWLESSTVRPRSRNSSTQSLEDRLHQRVEARGRLVEHQQLDVGGERGDQGDLLPVALGVGCGPSWSGRARSARSARRGASSSSPPRSRPSRSIDLAAGEVGPQVHVAGHVGEPPVQRGRVAPRVAAEQPDRRRRRCAAARAAPGWSWTCRRRWGRGSRAPPPRDAVRSSPSRAGGARTS